MKQQILPKKMLHKLQKVDRSTSRSKEKGKKKIKNQLQIPL